jgi:hypothetical protein
MSTVPYTQSVEVRQEVDVLVCGGGPAGLCAAIAARRSGRRVLLVEQSAILGGSATLAGVAIYMPVGNVTGLYSEFVRDLGLKDWRGRDPDSRFAPLFDPSEMRLYFNEKLAGEGVEVWYHSAFAGLTFADGRADAAVLLTREGLVGVRARAFIDATGNAQLAQAAGAKLLPGREDGSVQPMTLMFRMQETGAPVEPRLPAGCPRYDRVEDLPQGRVLHWLEPETRTLLVNMTRVRGNGARIEDINRAEREALRQVFGVADFLQRNGFPTYRLSWIAPQTGVRETCQVAGRHVLTEADCQAGRRFDDVVAQSRYGIDVHNPDGTAGTVQYEVPLYDIPYRCLVPADGAPNVIVAGRALSATPVAMSSARVMPTCMALGQAAGCAAAIAVGSGVGFTDVPVPKLHAGLDAQGVVFLHHGDTRSAVTVR